MDSMYIIYTHHTVEVQPLGAMLLTLIIVGIIDRIVRYYRGRGKRKEPRT